MTISYLFVFEKVLNTTSARPSKSGYSGFKTAVTEVLFDEKKTYFHGLGQQLGEQFKSDPIVQDMVEVFSNQMM